MSVKNDFFDKKCWVIIFCESPCTFICNFESSIHKRNLSQFKFNFHFFFSHKMVQHKFDSKTEWFSHFFNTFSFLLTLSCTEGILGKFSFFTKSSINKIWLLPFFFMIYQNDHKNIYIYCKKINFPKKFLGEGGQGH